MFLSIGRQPDTADDQCLLFISLIHQKPRGYWNNIDPAGDSLLLVLVSTFKLFFSFANKVYTFVMAHFFVENGSK